MSVKQEVAASTTVEEGRLLDGRYELAERIGGGGMAQVFRASDRRLGRTVAVKVLSPRAPVDRASILRFEREAEFSAGLSAHPNIVSVYDVGCDGDVHYIVMEWVAGRNLKTLLEQEGPLSVPLALHMAQEVAAALDFAHRHGFVHRDIKPQNILVGDDGSVKVTDFGIASSVDSAQVTRAGAVVGTAAYLSPEQARGRVASPQSDVYSLGVVLFEMLTGRLPFEGDGSVAVAMQHVHKSPPAPRSLNPSLPQWVDALVLGALAKDPRSRYSGAGRFREAMAHRLPQQRVAVAHPVVPPPPTPPPRVGSSTRTRWRSEVLALAILFVAAASAAGAYETYRGLSSLWAPGTSRPIGPTPHPRTLPPSKHPNKPNRHHGSTLPVAAQAAAVVRQVRFTYIQVNQTYLSPGSSLLLTYTLSNSGTKPVPVRLGVSLVGANGQVLTDPGHAATVSVTPGSTTYSRTFVVPSSAASQSYSLQADVDNPAGTAVFESIRQTCANVPTYTACSVWGGAQSLFTVTGGSAA